MTSAAAPGRLAVITDVDNAAGFRFAGAAVVPVATAAEAEQALLRLLAEEVRGVIAVHQPFYDSFDPALQRRCDDMVAPIVLPLPSGSEAAASDRRARLTDLLQRVIGYQISFEEPEP